jgi:hypothetical protein
MRQRQSSAQLNAGSTRLGRSLVEERRERGERSYTRVSADRYSRGWRTDRGLYARADIEGYGGERRAYRDRVVGAGVGVAATDHGYRGRPLYAYAPAYEASYTAGPYYNYAPGYDVAVTTGPCYTPGYNVAYASPYYDYAPGGLWSLCRPPKRVAALPRRSLIRWLYLNSQILTAGDGVNLDLAKLQGSPCARGPLLSAITRQNMPRAFSDAERCARLLTSGIEQA